MPAKTIPADPGLIAFCGLYCGACRSYLKGKCPGCRENAKASWCTVRKCCMENGYRSCADCTLTELHECKKYNNFMAKLFGLVFNSDRAACIRMIKEKGYDAFAAEMAAEGKQTIRRN